MIKDWIFSDENNICHFRAAAVLLRDGKLFIQRVKDEYALPGGRVAFGETGDKTLVREFKEEVEADVICDRLIWVDENFFTEKGKRTHEIAFYYLVSLKDDTALPDDFNKTMLDNKDVKLHWVPLDEIANLELYPPFIKDKIHNISPGVEHFVRNTW